MLQFSENHMQKKYDKIVSSMRYVTIFDPVREFYRKKSCRALSVFQNPFAAYMDRNENSSHTI